MATILIIEDEQTLRELYSLTLIQMGHDVVEASTQDEALVLLEQQGFNLILSDMNLGKDMHEGLAIVQRVQKLTPSPPIAVITAYGSTDNAIEAMKAGAYDYVSKPLALDDLRSLVKNGLKTYNSDAQTTSKVKNLDQEITGNSPATHHLRQMISRYANSMAPVMITGESGTGKERVARMIHECGARANAPFVAVNCGAIPENLLETEFFGHVKGAFTGADRERRGFFQAANGGTIFLDEIGEMPLSMQVKLLRVLQERKVRPVGDDREHPINIRVVCATHRNLENLIIDKQFREDLYYRLNVLRLDVLPLRERQEDILPIAQVVLQKICAQYQSIKTLSSDACDRLTRYAFTGNVRELENILERAFAHSIDLTIQSEDLNLPSSSNDTLATHKISPISPTRHPTPSATVSSQVLTQSSLTHIAIKKPTPAATPSFDKIDFPVDLNGYLENIERQIILQALQQTRFNKTEAATLLGLSFRQMRYRLKILDIEQSSQENNSLDD